MCAKAAFVSRGEFLVRLAALTLGVGVVGCVMYHTRGFRLDDGLIYARYVRNFLTGRGLVFNPGERWNAVTSPLYVWLLVAVSALGRDIPVMSNLIRGLATAATVYLLVFHLFGSDFPAWVGAGAGILYATASIPYLAFGMESALLVLLLTGVLIAYQKRHWLLFAVLVGLAGATRGEAVFLAGPLYLGAWRHTRKPPWRLALVTLLVMSPLFLFNLGYYGHLLPASLAAKAAQGHSGLWKGSGLGFLEYALDSFMGAYPNFISLGAVTFLSLLAFLGGRRAQPAWWIGLFAAALTVFYPLVDVPGHIWYLVPFVWAACLLVPMGVAALNQMTTERAPYARPGVLALGTVGFLVVLSAQVRELVRLPTEPLGYYVHAAEWLNHNVSPASTLGVAEVGHLGWYTNLKLVDMVGLVSPGNAQYLARGDFDGWLTRYHPDFILVHTYHHVPFEFGAIHALMHNRYGIVENFSEPGLVLLGPPSADALGMSLLGRPFAYTRDVREGAFRVGGKAMRGLLMTVGHEHIFEIQPQPDQVFVAEVGNPEGLPGLDPPPGPAVAVATVQSGSQTAVEALRQQVRPGAWETVRFALPAACRSGCRLILRAEPSAAGASQNAGPLVWAEPRLWPASPAQALN